MYEQRLPLRRARRRGPNCLALLAGMALAAVACVAVLGVAGVLLAPRLPGLAARLAGLNARGQTAAVFANVTPAPTVQLANASKPAQVTVDLGQNGGQQTLDTGSYNVQVGTDSTGKPAAVATFTEADLMAICQQRSPLCDGSNPQYKNPRIDLRPGGAIFYADAAVPTQYGVTLNQTVGVVMKLDSSGRQFTFAGIDLNGELYDSPPPQFADTVNTMQQSANALLTQITVDAGGGNPLTVSQINIDDNNLTLILR